MAQTPSERYSGHIQVRRVVSDFYNAILGSDLAHHFANVNMRELSRHQDAFIAYLTSYLAGGPGVNYGDEALLRTHRPLNITYDEFEQMIGILRMTLKDHQFTADDVTAVVGRFQEQRGVIVGPGAHCD